MRQNRTKPSADDLKPWAGIFDIERKIEMTYTRDTIRQILQNPNGESNGIKHNLLISRMLVALYKRQTEQEKSSHSTRNVNGVGFNKFDAEFLTDVAKKVARFGLLTPGQLKAVARSLVKYSGQLYDIAKENSMNRRDEQSTNKVLDNMAKEGMISPADDYLCQVCGLVKTSPSTWVEGKGNVCAECTATGNTKIAPGVVVVDADDNILEF